MLWQTITTVADAPIPDLQTFNKACHREFGASPRTLRGSSRH
ncbi:hypothetical protein [Glycomyces tritici]|uniref:HTH araC/xylS-type domain-containing protein n=1 Tax=Glycomyces tritici TaxID=2665176 RepID=A0ABT7YWU8_9ACTN|nr:hypothetical protein [Glycomyces tritici]MDN3243118.1 hypothetical protein [Glycomyces tritici]